MGQNSEQLIAAIRQDAFEEGRLAGLKQALMAIENLKSSDSGPQVRKERSLEETFVSTAATQTTMPRGVTLVIVEQIMRDLAPAATTPKQILAIAKQKKQRLSESAVGRSIRQLVEKRVVQQVGATKTWRYVG